jgi:hypothetical protein
MSRTSIQIPKSTRDKLRQERKKHESNYGETIERLLGDSDAGVWTKKELRKLIRDEME